MPRTPRRDRRPVISLANRPFRELRHPHRPYEILEEGQIEALHDASVTILETIGLEFLDEEALAIWQRHGARVDLSRRRGWIERGLLEKAIQTAPATFRWRARNPDHNLIVGENQIHFGPCGGMVYVSDLREGRRPGTQADLENFVRLSQMCHTLHFAAWEQVAPQDIDSSTRHLHRLYAAFRLSDKAVMEAAHGRVITTDTIAMARLVFGSEIDQGDPVIGDVINVNSPLRYDERMLGGLITLARAGQVAMITPFILAGAMSPVTMAAALAQQNAEALAGIALTQLVRPGAPVVYGGFTTNADLRSGAPAFGSPEGAWAMLAGAQLARRYRLPYRGSGTLTSAPIPDGQAMSESLWTLWPAVLGHTNLVMHAAGWLDGGLTASFEKFILDLEQLAMMDHFLAGFDLDPESLALDSIAEVGPGGHHFGTLLTQARFAGAFFEPAVATRQNFDAWAAAGGVDAAGRAYRVWQAMLRDYEAPPLDPAIDEALRDFVARRERELAGVNLYG